MNQLLRLHTQKEWQPSAMVAHLADSYSYVVYNTPSENDPPVQRCHPRGTVELMIHLQGPATLGWINGQWEPYPTAFLSGISEGSMAWKPAGPGSLFCIRLKPHAAERLLGMPMARFTNQVVSVPALYNSRLYAMLRQVRGYPNNLERIQCVEDFLLHECSVPRRSKDAFASAIHIIWQKEGKLSLTELSAELYLGQRQLQRVFKHHIGLSPKNYSRIVRFSHALRKARMHPGLGWDDLARDYGYADQSHFIRECKAISGQTPVAFLQNMLHTQAFLQ